MATLSTQHENDTGTGPISRSLTVSCRALHLGRRIDIQHFAAARVLAARPLTVAVGARGCAVVFRFGVVVLFDVAAGEEAAFRASLSDLVEQPLAMPSVEELDIAVNADHPDTVVASGGLSVRELSPARLQVIADVLAKSLILEHYETRITHVFDRLEPFAEELRQKGFSRQDVRALMRQTGDVLATRHQMVGRVEVAEKPEVLWDHPELEELHTRLVREFELVERDRALDRKFRLISDTAEALIGFVHNKHSLRVEWYIVILILFEILLSLYEMFLH